MERGRDATSPTEVPARGWKDVLTRTAREAKEDRLVLLAAGVAFFALLAVVPALVAVVSVYGLVADPADVSRHVDDLLDAAPEEVRAFAERQLESVAETSAGAAGIGLAVSLAAALWSASSGMKHLVDALNAVYEEEEDRGFLRVRALAVALTLGAVLFVLGAVAVIAVVPAVVDGPLALLRWPLLAVAFAAALAVLYRVAPDREAPAWRWTSPGAVLATVLWLAASGLFSLYAAHVGDFDETYGSLAGVVVVMLWLFLTAAVVLLGAELDVELERQTARDTTTGPERPLGARGAHGADTVGPTAREVRIARQRAKAEARASGSG